MGASAGETRSSKAVGLGYGIDGPAQLHQRGRQFDAVFDAVYPFAYPYNSAGGLENETFPSGRYTQSCYDAAGRVKSISGAASANATSTNYAGQVSYAPQGAIQSMARGDGLTEAWTYNNRLQPTGISVGTTGSPRSAFGLDLYYCAGKALACAGNNGNIRTANLSAPGVDQNFTYDPLNRLLSAAEGTAWAEGFSYDQFGNRWVDTSQTSGVTVSSFTATANSNFDANNRLQIMSSQYDGAGNQKQIGAYAFTWDAEGRMAASALTSGQTAPTTTYVYDGDGRRVMKQGAAATVYVYDAMGQLAAEYGGTPSPSCGTCYVTVDQLGSTRAVTDGATGNVVERHDYLPFGEELYAGTGGRTTALKYQSAGTPGAVTQRFTGKERDAETASSAMPDGLDYFGARYFSGAQGRFTSPDEFKGGIVDPFAGQDIETNTALPYADITDPQTLNKYTYVRNNPLRFIDPDGHAPSDLIYDGETRTLTLLSSKGEVVGTWPAGNNVAIHAPAGEGNGAYTNGPIENGTYRVTAPDQHGATMHLGGSENSAFGPQGIIHITGAKGATGHVMVGAGVHSGRENKGGPEAKTAGCIRTCTEAMRTINSTATSDPLKTVTVKNNDANVSAWQQQAAKVKAAEEKKKREQQ